MPPLLSGFVHTVRSDEAMLVCKHKHRQVEADSVLAPILVVLSFVPLIAHRVYTNCITRRAPPGGVWRPGTSILAGMDLHTAAPSRPGLDESLTEAEYDRLEALLGLGEARAP